MNGTRTPHAAGRPRAGFSLIEVALALIVAAGGLLAIFGVFPISLRQSANSRGDMGEMTFASTVLETIAGNIRTIDRIAVWNDPEQFWDAAVGNPPPLRDTAGGCQMVWRGDGIAWIDHPGRMKNAIWPASQKWAWKRLILSGRICLPPRRRECCFPAAWWRRSAKARLTPC